MTSLYLSISFKFSYNKLIIDIFWPWIDKTSNAAHLKGTSTGENNGLNS